MEYKEEKRICQNCKNDFIIEPDDFSFYEKIKVPPPTFCPHCRLVRRLIWRNERYLYKRECDMCKKNIISMYEENTSFPVYCPDCHRSDKWEALEYATDYDFLESFFYQFKSLFKNVPRQGLRQIGECPDSKYANFIDNSKNVYLGFSVIWNCEDVYYSSIVDGSKKILDSYNVSDSELIYEGIGSNKNYNCQYSYWSSSCIDCNFVMDCTNCSNCFGCVNLRNKKYCIWNKEYKKEEYEEKIREFSMSNYEFVKNNFKKFFDFSLEFPKKYSRIINCINTTGDELRDCNNTLNSFNSYGTENGKYVLRSARSRDSMDVCYISAEMSYEHASGGSQNGHNIKFIIEGKQGLDSVEYCDACQSCSNCFGCVALKSKQYCVLNKQYTKEEYFEMVEKIKNHMNDMPYIDSIGRVYKYGEFFPYELSPFGYNESVTNDHFPLTKEEIIERGYPYKEKIDNKYNITLKVGDIPDDIKDVEDSILNEVIECEISGRAFKITPFELQFYRRMNIPIPRLHPDERYKNRLSLRNPMILYNRSCMKEGCSNEFETTYAPERPEIVYCKECYQREVY